MTLEKNDTRCAEINLFSFLMLPQEDEYMISQVEWRNVDFFSPRLQFADRLLLLLTSLAMDLKACNATQHQQSMNELSIQDHKVVLSALQFLDVFGILPYLKCGVGVPPEKRFPSQVLPFIPVRQEGPDETNHLIGVMTGILVMTEVQELLELILSSPVCADVLAAFLQLVHHCDNADEVIQKHLKIQLYKQFLPKIPQAELVKLLMLLMGTQDIQVRMRFIISRP